MKVFAKLANHGECYCYCCLHGLYKSVETAIKETVEKYAPFEYVKVLTYTHDHANLEYDKDGGKHTHVMAYNSKSGVISQEEFEKACDNLDEDGLDYWEQYILEETNIK